MLLKVYSVAVAEYHKNMENMLANIYSSIISPFEQYKVKLMHRT